MGIIARVTTLQVVAAKADELLRETIRELTNDPTATEYQRQFPYRTAWLKCLNILNSPDFRRQKAYRAHYQAVLDFMSREWKTYLEF